MRSSHLLAAAALLLGACGEPLEDESMSEQPHREVIPAAKLARAAEVTLEARDRPLTVGASAPEVPGTDGTPTIVVFFRGHW